MNYKSTLFVFITINHKENVMPNLQTPQLICIILNDKTMPDKNKVLAIVDLIQSDLIEKYIFVFEEEAYQQILSEVLYMYEKHEKDCINESWIRTRIKLLTRNLVEFGSIKIRTAHEIDIDFIENIQNLPSPPSQPQNKNPHKKTGWQEKTYRRFERYCLFNQKIKGPKVKKVEELSLF